MNDAAYADHEAETDGEKLQAKWVARIEAAKKALKSFEADCETVITALRTKPEGTKTDRKRFNIAWANWEILRQATYTRPPVCVVASRHKSDNPVVRTVAEAIQRTVNVNNDLVGVHDALKNVRDAYLKFGRGTAWVRYEASVGQDGIPTDERVIPEYVAREDFLHGPGKVWAEVDWVARRVYMTKPAFAARFGEEKCALVSFGEKDSSEKGTKPADGATCEVWEIWCKSSNGVYWLSESAKEPIETGEPHLKLSGFFPCPPPVFGTLRENCLVPIPDLVYYESQVQEINKLTVRINALQDALKVRGFYAGGASSDGSKAIESAILSSDDRAILVPVPGWAAAAEKPNLGIVWLPIDVVATVIKMCIEVRRQLIDDVYQVTGISDILRGDSEASETATAQNIKAQWGSLRVRDKQGAIAVFAADICRIAAEIVAEVFQPGTIMRMAEIPLDEQSVALMRDDRMRSFSIDVETDSTIAVDEDADKARRIEFVTAVGGFLAQMAPLVAQAPMLAPLVGEMLKFAVKGFRVGRELEQVIEQTMAAIVQQAQQPPSPPPPDPKAEVDAARAQADIEKAAMDRETAQEQHGMKMQEMTTKHVIDMQTLAAKAAQPPAASR